MTTALRGSLRSSVTEAERLLHPTGETPFAWMTDAQLRAAVDACRRDDPRVRRLPWYRPWPTGRPTGFEAVSEAQLVTLWTQLRTRTLERAAAQVSSQPTGMAYA